MQSPTDRLRTVQVQTWHARYNLQAKIKHPYFLARIVIASFQLLGHQCHRQVNHATRYSSNSVSDLRNVVRFNVSEEWLLRCRFVEATYHSDFVSPAPFQASQPKKTTAHQAWIMAGVTTSRAQAPAAPTKARSSTIRTVETLFGPHDCLQTLSTDTQFRPIPS